MIELCFATNNTHKITEIARMLGQQFRILSLADIGCDEDLPENQSSLEGNSLEKAQYVFNRYRWKCFADDTGLEVEALNDKPGVRSARYAGPQKNAEDNIRLLLNNLEGSENRTAQFRTVITLFLDNHPIQFKGLVQGRIISEKRGDKGFGYDPVFIPDGYDQTFAEMPLEDKNRISHRGIAFRKLVRYLQQRINDQ